MHNVSIAHGTQRLRHSGAWCDMKTCDEKVTICNFNMNFFNSLTYCMATRRAQVYLRDTGTHRQMGVN